MNIARRAQQLQPGVRVIVLASTLTPDPLHSAFYDSHPPASVRIRQLRLQSSHLAAT